MNSIKKKKLYKKKINIRANIDNEKKFDVLISINKYQNLYQHIKTRHIDIFLSQKKKYSTNTRILANVNLEKNFHIVRGTQKVSHVHQCVKTIIAKTIHTQKKS